MAAIMTEYGAKFLIVHLVFGLIGLWVELINQRQLRVSHLCWAVLFGLFFMLVCMSDFDRVILKLPEKKK